MDEVGVSGIVCEINEGHCVHEHLMFSLKKHNNLFKLLMTTSTKLHFVTSLMLTFTAGDEVKVTIVTGHEVMVTVLMF